LVLNGALRGALGNTGWLCAEAARALRGRARVRLLHLAEGGFQHLAEGGALKPAEGGFQHLAEGGALKPAEGGFDMTELEAALAEADALLLATGTYWHSWGSPMQRLIEVLTPLENTPLLFGKPVGALVTMDSVGGAELGGRLLSVFNQLGCAIPPCTTLVLSRVAVEALAAGAHRAEDPNDDTWQLADLAHVLDNLLAGPEGRPALPWPVRHFDRVQGAYPAAGPLMLGSPRFLPTGSRAHGGAE
jgi:multimeric flavodoxin WrbA